MDRDLIACTTMDVISMVIEDERGGEPCEFRVQSLIARAVAQGIAAGRDEGYAWGHREGVECCFHGYDSQYEGSLTTSRGYF